MTATNPYGPPIVRGQYNLTDPATGKVAKLQRATNRLKVISDQSGLNKWLARTALAGAASQPDLIAAINAAAAAGDNRKLDDLAEMAREHGGGNSAARMGTAYHSHFEEWNLHGTVPADPDAARWLQGVVAAMDAAGMTINPWWVERVVANFESGYAGQIDGAVNTPSAELPVLIDLKTGTSVSYGLAEYAIQMALYAAATHYWDPATNECAELPAVDAQIGYIIHAPIDASAVTIYRLDIAAGAQMLPVIDTVMAWRKRKDIGVALTTPEPAAAAPAPAPVVDEVTARHDWVLAAAVELIDAGHGGHVAGAWPTGVPTLKQARESGVPLTIAQLDDIHRALMDVAGKVGHPFFAHGAYPDDDQLIPANDERISAMKDRVAALPNDLVERLHLQVQQHGIPTLSKGKGRRSQLDMVNGWLDEFDAEFAARRATAAAHLGELDADAQPAAMRLAGFTGPATLTQQAAERIGIIADAVTLGYLTFDGTDMVAAEDAFDRTLAAHGGAKRALIATAQQAAAEYGLARPSSSTQVASDVMLLAATAMATPSTNE